MNTNELTFLFTFVDDFFQALFHTPFGKKLRHLWENKRGPKKKLTLSEVVTLNLVRFTMRVQDLKTFHRIVATHYKRYFPELPNYENFLKATNRSALFISLLVKYLLSLNSRGNEEHYVDSTDVPVCKNHNIYKHRVAKEIAARGKTTKGWFYGFKLHGVCNAEGELENIFFTPGNVKDNRALADLILDLEGIFVCDAGYLLNKEELEKFFEEEKRLYIATRNNMKRLMSKTQHEFFKRRSVIENVWNTLKERMNMAYSLARGVHGLFRHYLYCICSYLLRNLFEKLNHDIVGEIQLSRT
jgi:hypothetical protein